MAYSLDPNEVKKVIDKKIKNKPYNRDQFMYYHLNRNHFNVGNEVTRLTQIADKRYKDNLGFEWLEVSVLKNFFHMPKGNWAGSLLGVAEPYSRKFLRDDNISGLGGEFEMIIRKDGKRIDALTHEGYQETYNFGKTRNASIHKLLDVDPHMENNQYTIKKNTGSVFIQFLNRE